MPGRRRKPGATRSITFDREVLDSLDETAEALTMHRSVLVNAICRHWLEDFEMPTDREVSPDEDDRKLSHSGREVQS